MRVHGRLARPEVGFIRIMDNDGSSVLYEVKERGDAVPVATGVRGLVMPILGSSPANTVEKKSKGVKCIGVWSDDGIQKLENPHRQSGVPSVLDVANLLNPMHHETQNQMHRIFDPNNHIYFPPLLQGMQRMPIELLCK